MQQQDRHAAIGAWTLTSSWIRPTTGDGDAAATISLEGTSTVAAAIPADPVTAARRWLADPARTAALDPEVRDRAERAIDVVAEHLDLLKQLAAELAVAVETEAGVDPVRIAHADELATSITGFSERLRVLLDPEQPAPDAADRLERGLAAAAAGGGLGALVDCL